MEDGNLTKVTETYSITVDEAGVISDAGSGILDGDCLVSMNMWGFRPEIFEAMKASFYVGLPFSKKRTTVFTPAINTFCGRSRTAISRQNTLFLPW